MKEYVITVKTVIGNDTVIEKIPYFTECKETETNFLINTFDKVNSKEFGLARLGTMNNDDKTKEIEFFTYGDKNTSVNLKNLQSCIGIINNVLCGDITEKSDNFSFYRLLSTAKGNNVTVYQIQKKQFIPKCENVTMTIKEVKRKDSNKSTKSDSEKFIAYCKKLLDNNTFDKDELKAFIDGIDLTVETKD